MARTGYICALPGHGLAYGIFKELLNGLSGTGRTKTIIPEIHTWRETHKKKKSLGKCQPQELGNYEVNLLG
jgi:hypothetical protein